MGLELGYDLYNKNDFGDRGALVKANIDTSYICGRCDVNSAFGDYFMYRKDVAEVPVFQKELGGKTVTLNDCTVSLRYVEWNDFIKTIEAAMHEDSMELAHRKTDNIKRRWFLEKEIKELRELQKTCTEDNAYAFAKWEEQIQDIKDEIIELEDWYNDGYKEEYSYIQSMRDLLDEMKEHIDENKYYVIPYFSY